MAKISTSRVSQAAAKPQGHVRDFAHASRAYLSDPGYNNAPKFAFGFHVRIVFNQVGGDPITLAILVKSVDLPKFNIETDTLNKYNKKEIVQKKITYEPVNITFHDDRIGTLRDFWLAYNQYYFADSNITQQAYLMEDTYSPVRLATKYGLDNDTDGRFLNSVEIYSFGDHRYTKYTLVNPIITSFDFDTHDYAEGGKVMQTVARVEYENVLYSEGVTEAIPGFGLTSPYYDNRFSDMKPGIVTPPYTNKPYQPFEQEKVTRPTEPPLSNFDLTTVPAVKLSDAQQKQIKVNATNSLQRNKKFSFPTASEINNLSSLVDINAAMRIQQGIMNKSGAVTSNGINVSSAAQSSIGSYTLNQEILPAILIQPKIPSGLTQAETQAFVDAYPALPSTDPRTRAAPYV